MSVGRCKKETSSKEFIDWQVYFDDIDYQLRRANKFDPIKSYLANIALETRRSYIKHPSSKKLEDFYIQFTKKYEDVNAVARTDEEKEALVKKSKSFWRSLMKGRKR